MLFKHILVGPALLVLSLGCSSASSGSLAEDSAGAATPGDLDAPASENDTSAPADSTPSTNAADPGAESGTGTNVRFGPGRGLDIDTNEDASRSNGSGSNSGSEEGNGGSDETEVPVETDVTLPAPGGFIRGAAPTLASATARGEFAVETFTEGLRDGAEYGTQTLHLPTGAEPPFASVAIVPGFTAPESSIRSWGPFLASHGIVTLTIGTNSPTDSPDARAEALLDALETLKAENTRSGGPLAGKIDATRMGVMGWSMGGGGTLIASNANPDIKAAITMAAWSPGESFSEDLVPTLLFAGSADNIAGGQSQDFFDSIPQSTPKMLYEVQGGSHSVANSPTGGDGEVGRYGLSWLKVFLESDERYRQFLLAAPTRESEFRENLSAAP